MSEVLESVPKLGRVPEPIKNKLVAIIQGFSGYKDLNCLASWLLFSGKQVKSVEDLYKKDMWNTIRKSAYPSAEGYLDGVEIVKQSFEELMVEFSADHKTLFVLDPPYLTTEQASYKSEKYFNVVDFMRLVHLVREPYIFFSSTKSEFLEFVKYMQDAKKDNWTAFSGADVVTINARTNHSWEYQDNMLFKF